MFKRHRGIYEKNNIAPYELSRSRIENFVRCPACFYLQQVKGIKFPSIPGFNINEATDVLLKRDFDKYRGQENTHPFLVSLGESDLIPFKHENFELWTQSLHFGAVGRMHFIHEKTNLTENLVSFTLLITKAHHKKLKVKRYPWMTLGKVLTKGRWIYMCGL